MYYFVLLFAIFFCCFEIFGEQKMQNMETEIGTDHNRWRETVL
jgi:hypothetical protein